MAASSTAALDASDTYAKHLAEWRDVALPAWQQELEVWDATTRLRPPPKPPTAKKKGLDDTPQRVAALEAAMDVWKAWHARWKEAKGTRRSEQKAAINAVLERDWKEERAQRPIRAECRRLNLEL